METEVWKDIVGYEGLYQVSSLGRVRSIKKGKIIKPRVDWFSGYVFVGLSKNGKSKTISVHRLVAMAFYGNEMNKPEVNHMNYNKQNNCVSNLEWVTRQENMDHAYKRFKKPYTGFVWQGYSNINTMEEIQPIDLEIAKYRGEGKPVKEIASLVKLPDHTVKYRIARMLKAMSCANSAQLLLKLAKMNLI